MEGTYKEHYKECAPEDTVKKLKKILEDMNIETECSFIQESEISTFSSRVVFKGTNFGSNGKGVTNVFCEASAYAELFERYQNDLLPIEVNPDDKKFTFFRTFDERIKDTVDIISESNAFLDFYFNCRGMKDASFVEKVDAFNSVQRYDYLVYGLDQKYVTIPYYSLKEKKVIYLPYNAIGHYYGSNGMCAGNTSEEALVQGLSEIYERVAQRAVFENQEAMPDIPEDYIEKYERIYQLYKNLKSSKEIHCFVKDCSFGGKYPVVALIVVEKDTGYYGVKFGCHPDFGVALERCFTEAAQGRKISEFTKTSILDFQNNGVATENNICNAFKIAQGQYPFQLFSKKSKYNFTPFEETYGSTNKTLLKKWIDCIIKSGYDVLIRDVSYLGFPSFHIIVPGLSELQKIDDQRFRAYNTRLFSRQVLNNPKMMNSDTIEYVIASLNYFADIYLENSASDFIPGVSKDSCPGCELGADLLYLLAMLYAYKGDYLVAATVMQSIIEKTERYAPQNDFLSFYRCVYHYFTAIDKIGEHNKVLDILRIFFNNDVCQKVDNIFKDKHNILTSQYYSSVHKNTEQDRILIEIHDKLLEKQISSRISQEDLAYLLND